MIKLIQKNQSFLDTNIRSVAFNVISILTGTGYVNAQFDNWGGFPLILFLGLMFIGGCAGSTTCGIKIFRVQILYKFIISVYYYNCPGPGLLIPRHYTTESNLSMSSRMFFKSSILLRKASTYWCCTRYERVYG